MPNLIDTTEAETTLPPVADWMQNGFHAFLRPYLRRHFDAVAVAAGGRPDRPPVAPELSGGPLVVLTNHPSWWDPVVAHFLNRQLFPDRQFRAPIDAAALSQYQVFERLGFFGIDGTRRGATNFLRTAAAVLDSPADMLWITPEGRFADVRDDAASLMPGLAHVCHRAGRGHAIALALEYVFWNERLPVCLAKFSSPIDLSLPRENKTVLLQEMTVTLRQTQRELSSGAIARSFEPFDNLLVGKSGGGFVYDTFRRLRAIVTGGRFQARHENLSGTDS